MLCLLAWSSSASARDRNLPELKTVPHVDIQRYLGTWYEIASYPMYFQRGCTGTTATYSLRADGEVDVLNRCYKDTLSGPEKVAQGRARVVDKATNAKLQVSFFPLVWADYWIIDLDPEYRYAVVGQPGRKYLWILSRTPTLDEKTLDGIRQRLTEQHYDLQRLQWTKQAQ